MGEDEKKLAEEAIRKLLDLDASDREAAHGTADDILVDFLEAIGHGDVAEAYCEARRKVRFWYA